MHYTYALSAEVDGRYYIGATKDPKRRVAQHEAGLNPEDAYRRERHLRSGRGGRYLRQRLASSLSCVGGIKLERH